MWPVISLVGCFMNQGGSVKVSGLAGVVCAAYLGWDISLPVLRR